MKENMQRIMANMGSHEFNLMYCFIKESMDNEDDLCRTLMSMGWHQSNIEDLLVALDKMKKLMELA